MICYKNHIYVILRYISFFFFPLVLSFYAFSFVLRSITRCQILLSYTFFDIEYYYYLRSSLYPFFYSIPSIYIRKSFTSLLVYILYVFLLFFFGSKKKSSRIKKDILKKNNLKYIRYWCGQKVFFISFYIYDVCLLCITHTHTSAQPLSYIFSTFLWIITWIVRRNLRYNIHLDLPKS